VSRTMWSRLLRPVFVLSVSLNMAFIAVWLSHAAPRWMAAMDTSKGAVDNADVSSSLHRELGVTPEQWNNIQPVIEAFREKAKAQRRTMGALRDQLMDLLAAPRVEETTIRAKQEDILSEQRKMQDLVLQLLLKEKEILTPKQQQTLFKAIHQQCICAEAGGASGRGITRMLIDDSLPFPSGNNEQEQSK